MPCKLVWLFDGTNDAFEEDWLNELLGNAVSHSIRCPPGCCEIYENACIVFNHSVPYEEYFQRYEDANIGFVCIHLSDETLGDTCHYLELASCKKAFRNYHHPVFSFHKKVTTFGLGYKKGFTSASAHIPWHESPWYHWCFAGAIHHEKRLQALQAFGHVEPYLCISTDAQFNAANGLDTETYRAMLHSSKFALCPIGQGNIDTYRFYEAMEAGCIPVAISSTPEQPYKKWGMKGYWHQMFPGEEESLPFVHGTTWNECVLQVTSLLKDPTKYHSMRAHAVAFWKIWKTKWSLQLRNALGHDT